MNNLHGFIKYPKIYRLGADENLGILDAEVVVQEKIDGANTSIWVDNGEIECASRNRTLVDDDFNGFVTYISNHEGIRQVLKDLPDLRLYGEWLVKHTISYKETSYKQFYLFDVMLESGLFMNQEMVGNLASKYNINYPTIFAEGKLTLEEIQQYVGKSDLGDKGEGVVIKNPEFVNQFGDMAYAKIVTQDFKESNAIVFGGNNKHSETYWEMYVANKYCTLARVQKAMRKIQPEVNEKLDKPHTSRIIMTSYHDLITEEMWEIQKKVPSLNFRKLKGFCAKKFARIYHDILEDDVSIAYKEGK